MAKAQNHQEKPTLVQEILAVSGIFIAVFIFICLASYSAESASVTSDSGNWGGAVGQLIAQMLTSFLGVSSFLLPLLVLLFSLQFFSPSASFTRIPYIVAGCSGIVLASTGLFGEMERNTIAILGNFYPTGGYLGWLLAGFFGKAFGGPGSVLFFVALLIVSLMAAVRFSLYLCGIKMSQVWSWSLEKFQEHRRNSDNKLVIENAGSRRRRKPTEDEDIDDELGRSINIPRVHEPVKLLEHENDLEEDFHPLPVSTGEFKLPSINLLEKTDVKEIHIDREFYYEISKKLEQKLKDFGVEGVVSGISPGPVITTYEFAPAPGVKINKVVSLADDIALGLKAESVRIVGSIPGKAALGIEIPNPERDVVHIRDILASEIFQKSPAKLTIGLGMDVVGNAVITNLAKMPHLLIAGATGSGKSVAINAIICSILFKSTPEEVRLLMVDPKRIELSIYEDIPHLLHPVVVDPKMASRALMWAVREMERRYELMEEMRVKNLANYNEIAEDKLPLIVIIIDELADLMMVSSREVEDSVARLAQMARAAGMHLILATQRPSVDVLTGLIKANFPTRISFKVSSKIDSRTILDTNGAEHLLGAGDMLFLAPGASKLKRIHGAFISEKETEKIVSYLKEQGLARYDESVLQIAQEPEEGELSDDEYDEKYDEAVALVCETGQASISMLQRRFRVGYNRAARMIETMEREGIVGPADGSKAREVLARKSY